MPRRSPVGGPAPRLGWKGHCQDAKRRRHIPHGSAAGGFRQSRKCSRGRRGRVPRSAAPAPRGYNPCCQLPVPCWCVHCGPVKGATYFLAFLAPWRWAVLSGSDRKPGGRSA